MKTRQLRLFAAAVALAVMIFAGSASASPRGVSPGIQHPTYASTQARQEYRAYHRGEYRPYQGPGWYPTGYGYGRPGMARPCR
ncbi:MAG: hypothetical protein ACYC6Y_06465 [Thermoguttaceae bacterium]